MTVQYIIPAGYLVEPQCSPLCVAFTFIHRETHEHANTHMHTSFIRWSIYWIARVLLLLNGRLVVPFFAAISPLHILYTFSFLPSFVSAHIDSSRFLYSWSQHFSYRFYLCVVCLFDSVSCRFLCVTIFASFALNSSLFHNEPPNLLMILKSISQIIHVDVVDIFIYWISYAFPFSFSFSLCPFACPSASCLCDSLRVNGYSIRVLFSALTPFLIVLF